MAWRLPRPGDRLRPAQRPLAPAPARGAACGQPDVHAHRGGRDGGDRRDRGRSAGPADHGRARRAAGHHAGPALCTRQAGRADRLLADGRAGPVAAVAPARAFGARPVADGHAVRLDLRHRPGRRAQRWPFRPGVLRRTGLWTGGGQPGAGRAAARERAPVRRARGGERERAARQACRAGRHAHEIGVPGQHEPRDTHPDERAVRHGPAGGQERSGRAPARLPGQDAARRPPPAGHPGRRAGLLQDRGRQAQYRGDRLRARAGAGRHHRHGPGKGLGQGSGAGGRRGGRGAQADGR